MSKKQKDVKPRNFVAKHQKGSGSGRHVDHKNDYRRQPKHRNRQPKEES